MGLYLCVFDNDEEIEGVDIGNYSDFDYFRSTVTKWLESGIPGSRFPTLILHSDSDGEWSLEECELLKLELMAIAINFQQLPGVHFPSAWQQQVANLLSLKPATLYDSFIDVDGEPLIERLLHLCDVAIKSQLPILFQ